MEIEKIYSVDKCIILKAYGKQLSDGFEYKISGTEGLFEDIFEDHNPIIVNDISKDKNMQRDLMKNFKLKVSNLMFIPIL